MLSPVEPQEEETDLRDKKKKHEKPAYLCFTEAEEEAYEHKILYRIGSELEIASTINFKIGCCYQGPDYEDDTPIPEEEPVKKSKSIPKSRQTTTMEPEEPVIRIITPEPEIVVQESGR